MSDLPSTVSSASDVSIHTSDEELSEDQLDSQRSSGARKSGEQHQQVHLDEQDEGDGGEAATTTTTSATSGVAPAKAAAAPRKERKKRRGTLTKVKKRRVSKVTSPRVAPPPPVPPPLVLPETNSSFSKPPPPSTSPRNPIISNPTPTSGGSSSKGSGGSRIAHVCPICQKTFPADSELVGHLETQHGAANQPFPGIKVRNRDSVLKGLDKEPSSSGSALAAGGNKTKTKEPGVRVSVRYPSAPVEIELPPLSVYLSSDYFSWK